MQWLRGNVLKWDRHFSSCRLAMLAKLRLCQRTQLRPINLKLHTGLQCSLLMILLSGCTAPQTRLALEQPTGLAKQAVVANVPFYPQEAYYCGPAALAMMLTWAGMPTGQEQVASQVFTPGRQGTLTQDVLAGARRHGALAITVDTLNDILTEISAGNPVMVFQNLGLKIWPQWHFSVAVGYDLTHENLVLHSGLTPYRTTDLHAFEQTWQRAGAWAVTITAPDHLPATSTEIAALKAAAGLERAAHYAAAITAYQAIIQRWPDSKIARMGIGNTEYKQERFEQAAATFRTVIQIDAAYAAAWNNLAHALAAQGLGSEAAAAARRAIALDAGNPAYQATLHAIMQN